MATQSAVRRLHSAQSRTAHLNHRIADALGDQHTWAIEHAKEWEDEMRAKLTPVRTRRRIYRELALGSHRLPAVPFRVLCYYLEKADSDLDNVFPSREAAAAVLGMTVKRYEAHVTWLCAHGWIKTHQFRRSDGTRSSSGIQLGIPFLSGQWWGPAGFARRREVMREPPPQNRGVVGSKNGGWSPRKPRDGS